MNRRPLIGITTYYVERSEINKHNRLRGIPGEDLTLSPLDYSRSVEAAGGLPVLLPVTEPDTCLGLLERLDGLLLAGGEDVDPLLYGEVPAQKLGSVNPVRDRFEFRLLEEALQREIPIFGICRGFQVLTVYFGGCLYQDLDSCGEAFHAHACLQFPKGHYTHSVLLAEGSIVRRLFGQERISVNSFHHQGLKTAGKRLRITAAAEDGLAEALESTEHRYVHAVQWHPETITETSLEHLVLFRDLVKQACSEVPS